MANLLSKAFVISDVDGTLLDDNHKISDKNKTAIKELIEAGGLFTLATGRGISMVKPVVKELGLKIPMVIFNGAVIYDNEKQETLWQCNLPDEAYYYLKAIHKQFPTAAIEVLKNDNVYVVSTNELEENHLAFGKVTPIRISLEETPKDGWIKTLIIDKSENIEKIAEFIEENNFNKTSWVRSAPVYYEMLPLGINKGTGLSRLIEITGGQERYTVAVGDFMNDIEMLKTADLGVAVENAQPLVKAAADIIVSDNNSSAIYDVIKYLKNMEKDGM